MRSGGPPEGKTQRTRAKLMTAAFGLFVRQGYELTTVAQIAAAAGVTEMTFYRHFGSKVQLLVDDPYDPLIAAAIGEQPVDLAPLVRAIRGIRLARRLPITDDESVRERVAIVAATPSLLPALRASTAATETAIAEQLVADGADATDAANAAAAAMAALMTGLVRWAMTDDGAIGTAVERSLNVLEPNNE